MKHAAIDVAGVDGELALAVADDYFPSAAEQHGDAVTIFFRSAADRERAREAIALAFPTAGVTSRDVDDEGWARRSQQNLEPITVGRITVLPAPQPRALTPRAPGVTTGPGAARPLSIVIQPSMGFGTGHHATTRLCLTALQAEDVTGRIVLDVGTGSGVLAIAAARLGAARALGIDNDPDAIQAARENLTLNPGVTGVSFELASLPETVGPATTDRPVADTTDADAVGREADTTAADVTGAASGSNRTVTADIVTANLTGALLTRAAARLLSMVKPGGRLIVSGLLDSERSEVVAAFAGAGADLVREAREAEWVGIVLRRREDRDLGRGSGTEAAGR